MYIYIHLHNKNTNNNMVIDTTSEQDHALIKLL